jgi:SLT domain-containing protein
MSSWGSLLGGPVSTRPDGHLAWQPPAGAGVNYAEHAYGPGWTSVLGQGHGYAAGTANAMAGLALVGERGPELVSLSGGQSIMNAAQTSSLLRGTSAQAVQAPWTASPAQQLLLDTMTPANNHAKGSSGAGGVTINLGGVTVQTSGGGAGITQTTADTQALSQQFEQAVGRAIQKTGLIDAIRSGNTG